MENPVLILRSIKSLTPILNLSIWMDTSVVRSMNFSLPIIRTPRKALRMTGFLNHLIPINILLDHRFFDTQPFESTTRMLSSRHLRLCPAIRRIVSRHQL
ncbi:hypothetical protein NEOLI_000748 [Neolecta irregularis DAH-3]|uniref:Uncharacterized protein n=1 Tax=Neolecta irregularis (strain DAH-3) TaxID=1198029 RepID=A0A1U7LWB4_NEOID|nr:hypothetical protein NEOLI_000748 [Neolecta irregularis DAH-3]|eukprot:OLL26957.1 hypothetical protein NEOLI_000748 [Neolecta irregularis DAH-3]